MKWFIHLKKILCLVVLFIQISDQSVTSTTAHFGAFQRALAGLSRPGSVPRNSSLGFQYSYIKNHVLPSVTRLASVSSYEMYQPTNHSRWPQLTHMKAGGIGSMTPYDQGIIVAIQNNTGDQLTINQISTASTSSVGSLGATGTSNHFLHTASLMPASMAAGAQDPMPGNMIEIDDAKAGARVYVQVVSAAQLQSLIASLNQVLNTVAGTSENAFAYYQASGASSSYVPTGQYFLLTNFNTASLSSSSATEDEVLMYRMQAVDISQFLAKPFTVTLQISKEKLGDGLSGGSLLTDQSKQQILYPSVVSIKTLMLQNVYDYNYNTIYPDVVSYCSIPPQLIPEDIVNVSSSSGIPGIEDPYNSWFSLYVGALSEHFVDIGMPGWNGDRLAALHIPVGLFDVATHQPPARVVIDASGSLPSGVVLQLSTLQKDSKYFQMYLLQDQVWEAAPQLEEAIGNYNNQSRSYSFYGGNNYYDDNSCNVDEHYGYDNVFHRFTESDKENCKAINAIKTKIKNLKNQISSLQSREVTLQQVPLQSESSYMLLMGCDVIDIGSGFHQDIPILNLYSGGQDANGNNIVVANQSGGDWINFSVTFGSPVVLSGAPTTFAQGYGVPYSNVMLFSLPTADMATGVTGELSQISAGNYELIFKDQTSQVLAVQKVFLDASIQNPTSMKIQFLNSADTGWTSSTLIPSTATSVAAGKTNVFTLQYGASGNTLTAKVYTAPVTSAAMTATASQTLTLDQGDQITQLWMSPTFESGNFAELPLQALHSKKLAQINKALASGTSVMIDWLVVSGEQGYDVLVSAYDKKAATVLCTMTMKNIPGVVKGKPSIANTDTYTGMNITYQIGSNATKVIPFGEKNGLEFKVTTPIKSLIAKKKLAKKIKTTGASAVTSPTKTLVTSPVTIPTPNEVKTVAVVASSVVTTKPSKKTTGLAVTSPVTTLVASPTTLPAVASKATTETVTSDEINTLKTQIQSLDTKVKMAVKSAIDEDKKTLKHLSKKTKKLLKKVKPGITAEKFAKAQKKYKKIQKKFNTIIPVS